MHKYELMAIINPAVEDRAVAPMIDKFLKATVSEQGGNVDQVDIWGRRRMTYPIQKHSEGIYVVVNATCSPAAIVELDRQLNLNESILRTKVLRKEEAVFSINPIEFTPDTSSRPARAPRGAKSGSKRPAKAK